MGVDNCPLRQAEGYIGDAQNSVAVKIVPDAAQSLQCDQRSPGVGGDGHGQSVDHHILPRDPIAVRGFEDLVCNRNAALCRVRNTLLVQYQAHYDSAVFSDQGKDRLNALFFPVDGVYHGLAVVEPHAALHGLRIGGIDLQGQREDALEACDHCLHHPGFIDLRQSHIDIQNMCPALLLVQAFLQDVFNIILPQSFLEFLLSGRIDPLADDQRDRTDLNSL